MRKPPRWLLEAILPLLLGLAWLGLGAAHSVWAFLLVLPLGLPLVATATGLLFWPGESAMTHVLALVCLIATPLGLLAGPLFGGSAGVVMVVITGLAMALAAAGCLVLAGRLALRTAVIPHGVPMPPLSPATSAKAAMDESLLGFFVASARIPRGAAVDRDLAAIETLQELAAREDWAANPYQLHRDPVAPTDYRLKPAAFRDLSFSWLRFDSDYAPHAGLPRSEAWQARQRNRGMAARIFEHPGAPRPWLICIHGYRMGIDGLDLSLFRAKRLHYKLGLNIAMPILPLHGRRSAAKMTGSYFLDGPMADLLHGQAQALWDLRRLKAWLAARQPGMPLGVLGYSLGGYHAALLACFEDDLASVIAGIPLTDIPGALWTHMPTLNLRYLQACGIEPTALAPLMAPVSPLALAPRLAHGRRHIFAATADCVVPPSQPLRLAAHWGEPDMHWYHGSHLSVRREAALLGFVDAALARDGLIEGPPRA